MLKKTIKKTLADSIGDIFNATPTSFDPEDDHIDDTRAKVIGDFSEENDNDNIDELLSTFRKQNVELLADVDERYAGKKASRKALHNFNEDDTESEDIPREENVDNSESEDANESDVDFTEDVNEGSEEEKSESSDSDTDENFEDEPLTENKSDFKNFKETDLSSQVKKGLCVRNQMKIWENLLEMRIQLQKCLIAANKMPQKDTYIEIKKESGQEFSDHMAVTKNSLLSLLDKLVLLQKISVSKYPETKNLNKSNISKTNSDEEVPSDTEDEKSADDADNEEGEVAKKKRKLSNFEKEISESHDLYKDYRNSVIQKWNDKTKIAVLKNNANSHSVLNHIAHTLSDKSKLIRRTQLKRSDYSILGQEPSAESTSKVENANNGRVIEEHNSEIFDDDDFYHQLLRELIEVKSADLTDPIQLSRQWIQLQKLRSKMKRKIDTRATKGRKIRYTVHTKLVNFMAPVDDHLRTDQAQTELFNSLFGKKEYVGHS